MFLRTIYDDKLAQAAYLIGCQRTGEAIIIDPQRDVDRYVDLARRNGLRLVAAAETHIHADFLSGVRELAERGATAYLSDEGDADWKYGWLDQKSSYRHQLLHDGDMFRVGQIEFRAVHTPGHTPEHLCFLVTDRGGGAGEPMGLASGDFVFVGDLGRPDLLETAAGQSGASEPAARRLFQSVRQFVEMPEFLQVWPAHGAGSACGKALGAVPQTTVGYEKRFNPAIRAATSESTFVSFILAGQPEPPLYFARMKRENRDGPRLLGALPRPRELSIDDLKTLASADGSRSVMIDTRPWSAFRAGHIPGALFIPQDGTFPTVAGSYIEPQQTIHLIVEQSRLDEAVRDLVRIGLDEIAGYATPEILQEFAATSGTLTRSSEIDVMTAAQRIESTRPFLLDVRGAGEFADGHIPGAIHIVYPHLPRQLDKLPKDRPIIVNCQGGGRSARACAYLQSAGFDVANLSGGMSAWKQSGLTVEQPQVGLEIGSCRAL